MTRVLRERFQLQGIDVLFQEILDGAVPCQVVGFGDKKKPCRLRSADRLSAPTGAFLDERAHDEQAYWTILDLLGLWWTWADAKFWL